MSTRFKLFAIVAIVVIGLAILFGSMGSTASELLWRMSDSGTWLLPLLTVTALVDSVNPCAFSILLITIAFLMSVGHSRRSVLAIGSVYILGIFIVYLSIGLGILQVLHLFNTPHFMAKLGAVILLVVGLLNVVEHFFPDFPLKLRIPTMAHGRIASLMNKATIPAALLLGILVGLCEFPCTGGPYMSALGLLHDQASRWVGLGYLLLYNLIFVLPLVIMLALASEQSFLSKLESWKARRTEDMRLWTGIAAIILAFIIYSL
ncbi:MAG: hypothetical protein COV10_04470 [Candidatus Vogelbacteria bacterium CG10_big_fil_rev_8_21_14_0_10_51_16]|uniref:Uncharacterized protein n=1 Tax=Candidatus Vogelbacteria bacterium CG10_big_fil_rev_8_21_14_0_10_51_16 TaxID=1975045 RepID=A0A2H0RDG4_9BACT|nr:MAG: hypothetical protein COV10_04470 [Candidatus Vogelbacteria bacterium CG10_big_fil_rev_8_21_14_0_10_51_16]